MNHDDNFFRSGDASQSGDASSRADELFDDPEEDGIGDDPGLTGAAPSTAGTPAPMMDAHTMVELSLKNLTVEERAMVRSHPLSSRVLEDLARTFASEAARGAIRRPEKLSARALAQLDLSKEKLEKLRGDLSAPKAVDPVTVLASKIDQLLGERSGAPTASAPAGAATPAEPAGFLEHAERGLTDHEIAADLAQLDEQLREPVSPGNAIGLAMRQQREAELERKLRAAARETAPSRARAIIAHARQATARRVEAVLHASPASADHKSIAVELAWERRDENAATRGVHSARFVIDSEEPFPSFAAAFSFQRVAAQVSAWSAAATPHGREQAAALLNVIEELQPDKLLALHPYDVTIRLLEAAFNAAFIEPGAANRAYKEYLAGRRADGTVTRSTPLAISSIGLYLMIVAKRRTGVPDYKRDGADALFAWAGITPMKLGPNHPGPTALAALALHRKLQGELYAIGMEQPHLSAATPSPRGGPEDAIAG